jgi:hypothetical protein
VTVNRSPSPSLKRATRPFVRKPHRDPGPNTSMA